MVRFHEFMRGGRTPLGNINMIIRPADYGLKMCLKIDLKIGSPHLLKTWTPPPPLPPSQSEKLDLGKRTNKFPGLKPYGETPDRTARLIVT